MFAQVAQAGREPHGRRVLVGLPAAPLVVLCRTRGRRGEPRDRVAEGAAERGRLLGRALARVRGRDEDPRLVRRQSAGRHPQALWQRPLAVTPVQVAEQLVERLSVHPVAERLRGLLVQQVRLVDDHVLEGRQRVAAGEQQGVVDADQVRGLGAGSRQTPVAAAARGAVAAQARRPRRAQLPREVGQRGEDLGRPVRQRREVHVAAPRAAHEVGEGKRALGVGQRLALRRDRLVEVPPAEVVLAPHEERPAPAARQPGGDERQLGAGQLPLQRLGLGAHDDAAAGGRACVRRRQQVAEALAHAGASLEDADAAAGEHAGGGLGVGHLTGAAAKAGEAAGEAGGSAGSAGNVVAGRIELLAPGAGLHRQDGERPRAFRRLVGDERGRGFVGPRRARVEDGKRRPGDALEQAPLDLGEAGRAAREVSEHRRGRLGVRQRPVCGPGEPELLHQHGQRVAVQLGEEEERRLEGVEPAGRQRRRAAAPRRRRQVLAVEAGVVPHERRVAGELPQAGEGLRDTRRAGHVGVRDAGEPRDEQRDGQAGVDEGREAVGDGEVLVQADGADVDDAVAPGVETGGLGVDHDEPGAGAGHEPRIAEPVGPTGARPTRAGDL